MATTSGYKGKPMDRSVLVNVLGFPATLLHGDPTVLDRWAWLKKRLPRTRNNERLLDVGCGSGAFSIGAALRGYRALGVSWDERDQLVARERAKLCRASCVQFEVMDVRELDQRADLASGFDVVICLETIPFIIDDTKLMTSMAHCLKPGGRLLLSAPYLLYKAISLSDMGPFGSVEDGRPVRRGYNKVMLEELCDNSGLKVECVEYCGGYLSQRIAGIMRSVARIHPLLGWLVVLPLRVFPPIFDPVVTRVLRWPHYSICLEAYRPRRGY